VNTIISPRTITSTQQNITAKPPSITRREIMRRQPNAHLAHGHHVHATHHATEAAKHHVEEHGDK